MTRHILGIQPIREALRAHADQVERVLLLERSGASSVTLEGLARFAQSSGATVEWVDAGSLDRIAKGVAHQGALAFAADLKVHDFDDVLARSPNTIVLLDQISDPHNFGAVIRSSVAFGADAIVWPEHASAPLTPATFRASAGAIEHATLCRVRKLPATLQQAHDAAILVVGLAGDGEVVLTDLDLTGPVALVIGSEGSGIRRTVRSACDRVVRLPTMPPVPTLNASVAAAIALYEVRRQRLAQAAALAG